jgi:hypothetical protein
MKREQTPREVIYRAGLLPKVVAAGVFLFSSYHCYFFFVSTPVELKSLIMSSHPGILIMAGLLLTLSFASLFSLAFSSLHWGRSHVRIFPRNSMLPFPVEFARTEIESVEATTVKRKKVIIRIRLKDGTSYRLLAGVSLAEAQDMVKDLLAN